MIKNIVVFDLDDTLAKVGGPVLSDDLIKIKELEAKGVQCVVCSGKPIYYLCGMMRQAGLKKIILVGENGASIQFGTNLPPRVFSSIFLTNEVREIFSFFKNEIKSKCSQEIWFQPGEYSLTPFPTNAEDFEIIQKIIDENIDKFQKIAAYRHCDSFDFLPKNINKAKGIEKVLEILDLKEKQLICIGDGVNDLSMFKIADISIGIQFKDTGAVDFNFNRLSEALNFLFEKLNLKI